MNPFSPESIASAVNLAVQQQMVPEGKTGVLAIAAAVENGQAVVKGTFATRIGDHWELGLPFEWHGNGDYGAGINIIGSWP
jgi:hypothetical protein